MRQLTRIAALFALTLHGGAVDARDVNGNYAVFGVGSTPCADYLAARDAGGIEEEKYIEWISGHLSAYNLLLVNTYNMLGEGNAFALLARLDSHCRREREQPFVQAFAIQMENLYEARANLSPDSSGWQDWLEDVRKGRFKPDNGEPSTEPPVDSDLAQPPAVTTP